MNALNDALKEGLWSYYTGWRQTRDRPTHHVLSITMLEVKPHPHPVGHRVRNGWVQEDPAWENSVLQMNGELESSWGELGTIFTTF